MRCAEPQQIAYVTLPGRAMQQGITTEEAVPWATDTALNLAGGGAPMAERGAAGAFGGRLPTFEGPIRAYHSSPHDFEQFDLGKIGTGEGAQVYGHGIYAAENPAVSGRWTILGAAFSTVQPEEMDAVQVAEGRL